MNRRTYAFLAAITALLTSGVLYNSLAEDSEQLDAAAARVARVPMDIGVWHGKDDASEASAFEQTGAKGYWMRHYVNQKTKESVLVILMCGRPGKMAVHTPEVCYRGAGYELHEEPKAVTIMPNGQFWTAKFTKKAGHLRLYWAWNARDAWEAAPTPRWQFRGEPFLYKLYVSHDDGPTDVAAAFLREFTPVLQETLFAGGSPSSPLPL